MKKFGLYLVGLFFLGGCGTDTGNPGLVGNTISGEIINPTFTIDLIYSKLKSCEGALPSDFRSRLSQENLAPELGLDPVRYPNLGKIVVALTYEELTFEDSLAKTCIQAVSALECSDPLVTGSYDPSHPNDLSQTGRLLQADPSCGHMIR